MNLYSFLNLYGSMNDYNEIKFLSDGSVSAVVFGTIFGGKLNRYSFDFTSVADDVFRQCVDFSKPIYFVGSSDEIVSEFVRIIKVRHSNITISGFSNGYFSGYNYTQKANEIIESGAEVVIIGMGAPRQEDFSIALKQAGYKGSSYTCGGFMHQTAGTKGDYYPVWIDKINLRFLYRMVKEPNTISRYLFDYPRCVITLFVGRMTGKIRFEFSSGGVSE